MTIRDDSPVLNPVLRLRSQPRKAAVTGGGKGRENIKQGRLRSQRAALSQHLRAIGSGFPEARNWGGKTVLLAKMYDESYAPSWTPHDLFGSVFGSQLIAPFRNGYLVEISVDSIGRLAREVSTTQIINQMVDISRIKEIGFLTVNDVLAGRTSELLWDQASETNGSQPGKIFAVWFAPIYGQAREDAMSAIADLGAQGIRYLPDEQGFGSSPLVVALAKSDDLSKQLLPALRHKTERIPIQFGPKLVAVSNPEQLKKIAGSGAVTRINPIAPIELTSPAMGIEPSPVLEITGSEPIVAIVDGGLSAKTYFAAEAWRHGPPLVADEHANYSHGNQVSALAVNGFKWNDSLDLPQLVCRIGTVQALAKRGSRLSYNLDIKSLAEHLDNAISSNPDTRIWNFSLNQEIECDPDAVSELGLMINGLARKHGILPVISIGNCLVNNPQLISPPADSEAALAVAGRTHDKNGAPSGPCPKSRVGPGPEGMFKPDLSWFSTVRVIGGKVETGTSYSTPLVSSLAAHTWERLREPSPDTVRALLLDRCDHDMHCVRIGWGSPETLSLPWNCPPGSVTVLWSGELIPGVNYYFEDIEVPETLIVNGKLRGKISLTAILDPVFLNTAATGNYFMARVEASLQARNSRNEYRTIVGSLPKDTAEAIARKGAKWSPTWKVSRVFSRATLNDSRLRLRARVYMRDLWQIGLKANQISGLGVVFAVTFTDTTGNPATYDSFVASMVNEVESAVVEQQVEISIE